MLLHGDGDRIGDKHFPLTLPVVYIVNVMKAGDSIPLIIETAIEQKREHIRVGIVDYASGGQRRPYPWRIPGRGAYEVLIAEVMLKRTTATAAANVYYDFLRRFPTVEDLYTASEEQLAMALSPIGLQRQRARSVKALSRHLVEHEGGRIPVDLVGLLAIPGVGDYSARAVLSFAFDTPAAIVDSNVERILQRVFLHSFPSRPSQPLYQGVADRLLPPECHREFNWGMLDLGALVCRPGVPRCGECPLTAVCDYHETRGHNGTNVSSSPTGKSIAPTDVSDVTSTGPRLRAARKAKGLSLVELSRRSGVSKLTIIKAENGRTTPSRATIRKLAAALNMLPEELQAQLEARDTTRTDMV